MIMKTIFKTFLLLLILLPSCHEEQELKEETKPDYSSKFNYNVSLWCANMTKDVDVTLQLVYLNSYKRELVSANTEFIRTRINALELLQYFHVDMSDSYLENGEIRYYVLSGKEIIKYGRLNKNDNLADIIITKNNNGDLEVSGTSQKHLD